MPIQEVLLITGMKHVWEVGKMKIQKSRYDVRYPSVLNNFSILNRISGNVLNPDSVPIIQVEVRAVTSV
jgi:hypothetical protein